MQEYTVLGTEFASDFWAALNAQFPQLPWKLQDGPGRRAVILDF